MATAEEYASWITANADKRGTPEFETVAQAYQAARATTAARQAALPSHAARPGGRSTIQQDVADIGAGAVQGAANIGSTLLALPDRGMRGLSPEAQAAVRSGLRVVGGGAGALLADELGRVGRRQAVTGALQDLGADTTSLPFKAGEAGAQIAGTAGVGPALGARVAAFGLPRLAQAISSGGFAVRAPGAAAPAGFGAAAAEQGIRAAGGAIGGGASAALANPEDAALGATVGGLLPGAARAAWLAGRGTANVLAQPFRSVEARAAPALGAVLPDDPLAAQNALAALRAPGQQLVPGSMPNAAEASMDPGIANLVRAVQASGGRQLFDQAETNALARTAALGQVGRFGDNVAQAREDLGQEVTRRIIPEERAISGQIRQMFNNVDPNREAQLYLPTNEITDLMRGLGVQTTESLPNALQRYVGAGTVGAGARAREALGTAQDLTAGVPNTAVPGMTATELQPVGWEELQNLRSSLGSLARSMRRDPATARDAAALEAMQGALDARVAAAARGELLPGEVFTPTMNAQWQAARAAHAAKVERFRTGPQRRLFEQDASGQPRMGGGEIPAAFWNSTPGQAEDVAAFRRLVDDSPRMLDQLRSVALTEAQQGANAAGNLTPRAYSTWLANHTPALNALMDPGQMQALQAIAADLQRSSAAQGLGRVSGSDTMQKATAMMGNALLDNPVVGAVASRIPIIGGSLSGPALAAMRDAARRQRATELAAVLSDPNRTAQALEILLRQQQPLGASAANALGLGYRAAPVAIPGSD